jgi:hypothetical protein
MTKQKAADKIKEHFDYLFTEYGFKVHSESDFPSFGNWAVVLLSNRCRLRFFQDRGTVFLDLGPPHPSPEWQAGSLHGLNFLIEFLTKGKEMFEYEHGEIDEQLKRLADALHVYLDQICQAFDQGDLEQDNDELKQFSEQWNERFWDRLKRKGGRDA